VNDSRWVSRRHGSLYQQNKNGCKACHGTDLLGPVLTKVPTTHAFPVEGRLYQGRPRSLQQLPLPAGTVDGRGRPKASLLASSRYSGIGSMSMLPG